MNSKESSGIHVWEMRYVVDRVVVVKGAEGGGRELFIESLKKREEYKERPKRSRTREPKYVMMNVLQTENVI